MYLFIPCPKPYALCLLKTKDKRKKIKEPTMNDHRMAMNNHRMSMNNISLLLCPKPYALCFFKTKDKRKKIKDNVSVYPLP